MRVNNMLVCDMVKDCTERVTHIGEKGYVYCSTHAPWRTGWERTRKLTTGEVKQLEGGTPLSSYVPLKRIALFLILAALLSSTACSSESRSIVAPEWTFMPADTTTTERR